MNCKILTVGVLWLFVFSGCAALYKKEIPEEPIIPELKWDLDSYAEFVEQNMTEIDARYSSDYITYEFVVDTEYGSTIIQNLIDLEAASAITADLGKYFNPEYQDKLVTIYQYIIEEYDYILDPHTWQPVAETIKIKKGDCKSLSLLLMSFFFPRGTIPMPVSPMGTCGLRFVRITAGLFWNWIRTRRDKKSTACRVFTKIRFTKSMRIAPKNEKELNSR